MPSRPSPPRASVLLASCLLLAPVLAVMTPTAMAIPASSTPCWTNSGQCESTGGIVPILADSREPRPPLNVTFESFPTNGVFPGETFTIVLAGNETNLVTRICAHTNSVNLRTLCVDLRGGPIDAARTRWSVAFTMGSSAYGDEKPLPGPYVLRAIAHDGRGVDSSTGRHHTHAYYDVDVIAGALLLRVEPPAAQPGTEVTLRGAGVHRAVEAVFGGTGHVTPLDAGNDVATVIVPASASTGALVVRLPDGGRAAAPFVVLQPPPTVTGVSPAAVGAGLNPNTHQAVPHATVHGTNLGPGTLVRFCQAQCQAPVPGLATGSKIEVFHLPSAPGDYRVQVATPSHGLDKWVSDPAVTLTVAQPPRIERFLIDGNPSFAVRPGQRVDVYGQHFVGDIVLAGVSDGNTLAAILPNVESPQHLSFRMPSLEGVGFTASVYNASTDPCDLDADPSVTEVNACAGSVKGSSAMVFFAVTAAGGSVVSPLGVAYQLPPIRVDVFHPHEGLPGSTISLSLNHGPVPAVCFRPVGGTSCFRALVRPTGSAPLNSLTSDISYTKDLASPSSPFDVVVPLGLDPGRYVLDIGRNEQTASTADLTPPHFTVLPDAPTIAAISPTSGAAGTEVTLTGENFVQPLVVSAKNPRFPYFVPLPRWEVLSATEISFVVPTGSPAGDYQVRVTTLGGEAIAPQTFSVPVGGFVAPVSPPTIASFTPSTSAAGSTIIVEGTNFVKPTAACLERDGACLLLPTILESRTRLKAVLPLVGVTYPVATPEQPDASNIPVPPILAPLSGDYTLRVVNLGGQDDTSDMTPSKVSIAGQPIGYALSPPFGRAGQTFDVLGDNLARVTRVTVGDATATFRMEGDALRVTVPANAPLFPAPVKLGSASGETTVPVPFARAMDAPKIHSISPTEHTPTLGQVIAAHDIQGALGPDRNKLVVRGENLGGLVKMCLMGPSTAPTCLSRPELNEDPTKLEFAFHDTLLPGRYVVHVATLGGAATSSQFLEVHPADPRTVFDLSDPQIGSFAPREVDPGQRVTLRGSGFRDVNRVDLLPVVRAAGHVEQSPIGAPVRFTVKSDTLIELDVPPVFPPGPYAIFVGNRLHWDSSRTGDRERGLTGSASEDGATASIQAGSIGELVPETELVVRGELPTQPMPVIESVSPLTATGGTEITVTGRNLGFILEPAVFLKNAQRTVPLLQVSRPETLLGDLTRVPPPPSASGVATTRAVAMVPPGTPPGDYEVVVLVGARSATWAGGRVTISPTPGYEKPVITGVAVLEDPLRLKVTGKDLYAANPLTSGDACIVLPVEPFCLDRPLVGGNEVRTEAIYSLVGVPAGEYRFSISRLGGSAESGPFVVPEPIREPKVTSFEPRVAGAGTLVTVSGESLQQPLPTTFCLRKGTTCAPLALEPGQLTSTRAKVRIPPGTAADAYTIEARVASKVGVSAEAIRIVGPPDIEKMDETARPGETVVLRGARLSPLTQLMYGRFVVPASEVTATADGTRLTFKVPAGATPLDILVRVTTIGGFDTHQIETRQPIPVIKEISPLRAPAGSEVVIRGAELDRVLGACVRIVSPPKLARTAKEIGEAMVSCTPVLMTPRPSDERTTTLRVKLTSTLGTPIPAGKYAVVLHTWDGQAVSQDAITVPEGPKIVSVGSASRAEEFEIRGQNFRADMAVKLAPVAPATGPPVTATLRYVSSTLVYATMPMDLVPGTRAAVTATTPDGSATFLATTVTPRVPAVTRITPGEGASGQWVTLEGTGLFGVRSVTIGTAKVDLPAPSRSDTQVSIAIPSGLPPFVPLPVLVTSVAAAPPDVPIPMPVTFTAVPPPPSISSVRDDPAKIGHTTAIRGSNLMAVTGVHLERDEQRCSGFGARGCTTQVGRYPLVRVPGSDSESSITVSIPPTTPVGKFKLVVTDARGRSATLADVDTRYG